MDLKRSAAVRRCHKACLDDLERPADAADAAAAAVADEQDVLAMVSWSPKEVLATAGDGAVDAQLVEVINPPADFATDEDEAVARRRRLDIPDGFVGGREDRGGADQPGGGGGGFCRRGSGS